MPIMGSREHPGKVPSMLKDGTYASWFRTPHGQGTGIVHVAHGKLWGRDGVMTYDGTCEVDGDRFTATIRTRRHTEGLPTVFGDDQELGVKLEGTCSGKLATYVGTAEQFPGVILEGVLLFSEPQQPRAAEAREPIPEFVPAKLPKLPKRSR
jgi:hypothetical protein